MMCFKLDVDFFKGIVSHLHDVLEAAEVALIHACDLSLQFSFVTDFLQLEQPSL